MDRYLRKDLRNAAWLAVAVAALVAQAAPRAWSGDCDRGCCAAVDRGCCADCPSETPDSPCRCLLEANPDQPLADRTGSDRRVSATDHDLIGQGVADSTVLEPPPALGVSREYLAASLAVPIRPVRILLGIWRN